MKKSNLFLIFLSVLLFSFVNTVKAQEFTDCVSLVETDGCTFTFSIDVASTDPSFIDPDNPTDVIGVLWTYRLVGDGTIVSAEITNDLLSSTIATVQISNSGKEVFINFIDPSNPIETWGLLGSNLFYEPDSSS